MIEYDRKTGILTLTLNKFKTFHIDEVMSDIMVYYDKNGIIAQIQWLFSPAKEEQLSWTILE